MDEIRLEGIQVTADDRRRQRHPCFGRDWDTQRGQGNDPRAPDGSRRDIWREDQHLATCAQQMAHRQVGRLGNAVYLRQERLGEDGDSFDRCQFQRRVGRVECIFVPKNPFNVRRIELGESLK